MRKEIRKEIREKIKKEMKQENRTEFEVRTDLAVEELKAERNHVSEAWTRYGVQVNSALQSQALLQVKREYCDTHRCLHCKIGAEIFRRVGRG